jgi:hypothetical protein
MRGLFYRSFEKFIALERENILNGVSERNLCARLGQYLEDERRASGLDGYFVDPEYNRQQNGRIKTILDDNLREIGITCDLILHSRGHIVERDNLIAIEMKKSDRPAAEKGSDRLRLKILTRDSYDGVWSADGVTLPEFVCGYELGVFIELNLRDALVTTEEFRRGQVGEVREFSLAAAAPEPGR